MENQRHIHHGLILVPCPYQGHITPMLQLATFLHSKGFSITIVHTHFNSPNPFNCPDFEFVSMPDGLSDEIISSGEIPNIIHALNENCQVPFKEYLVQKLGTMQETHNEDRLACVIYDELMYFSEAVASELKLPSIILRTNSAAAHVARGFVLQLIADGCLPLQDSLLQEPVPEHYPLRFKDLPTSHFQKSQKFVEVITNMREVRTSSAVIWNTIDVIEKLPLEHVRKQCDVPNLWIGPIHRSSPTFSSSSLKEDDSCISWLDKQSPNSVIYVSLGSIVSFGETELVEMAWGLANSKQPFLWVVRPDSGVGSEWIEKAFSKDFKEAVKERGHIVKWAPQKEVLAHKALGGFWTHCGWNSILESISEGVPLICRPSFGDQKVTARYVSHVWRVGLEVQGGFERGEIERVIRMLMVDKEGQEMRQRALELKERVEICTKEGGSSYNSLQHLINLILSF